VNPGFRTVALISGALGLIVSLFFALNPRDDNKAMPETTTTAATTTNQTTTTAPTTTAAPGPGTVRINYTISGGRPVGGINRDSVARGRIVVIRVTSDIADEVHVHGYDLMADVAPDSPATIKFKATAPGRFEIELEEHKLPIAELEVRP
jgi:hypothetical protein